MTVTVKSKSSLTVPVEVQRQAGIKTGDRLEFKVSGGIINIIPRLPAADDEYSPEQRRIIDARLAKADEEIKHGRVYGPFNTPKRWLLPLTPTSKNCGQRNEEPCVAR